MKIWNWKRQIDEHEFNQLATCGFSGWDRRLGSEYDQEGNPLPHIHKLFRVDLEFVVGSGIQSRGVAVEWDSQSEGAYYYHDRTDTGISLVHNGQLYGATFWFQWYQDAQIFYEIFGGNANWTD